MDEERRRGKKSLLQKYEISLDQLTFEYIEQSRDVKTLERIVRILKSGEEGYYPDLTKAAEDKLRKLNPKSRLLRVEEPVLRKGMLDPKQWGQISNDLMEWSDEIKEKDLKLTNSNKNTSSNIKLIPEIRQTDNKDSLKQNKDNKLNKVKSVVPRPYSEWDKYNPDVELLKMDIEEDKIKEEKKRKQKEKIKFLNDDLEEEIKREKKAIEEADYTNEEKLHLAYKEKEKGNEFYSRAEYKEAIKHYTKSLMLSPSTLVYNNRAIAYIKLNQFAEALNDSNKVLEQDPNNLKALYRRATAYQNLNYFHRAYNDFLKIVELEPDNKQMKNLAKQMELRCQGKLVRMKIKEEDSSESQPQGFIIPEPEYKIRVNNWGLATTMCSCNSQPDWINDRNINKYVSTDLSIDSNQQKENSEKNWNKSTNNISIIDNNESSPENTEVNDQNTISQLGPSPPPPPPPPSFQKNQKPIKITHSYEFLKVWQSIKNDRTYEEYYHVLKSIKPDELSSLIGNNLDADMLLNILECLDKHFLKENIITQSKIVLSYLQNLIKSSRFEINFMLMEKNQAINNIFLKLTKENIDIPNEIKCAFKI